MGDRSNVSIVGEWDGATVLYSHWGGTGLFESVQNALHSDLARGRWNDSSYLRRIIFQAILNEDGLNSTGFGLSGQLPDNEYRVLVLDTSSQRAAFVDESHYDEKLDEDQGWTFEEFIQLKNVRQFG